MIIQTSKTYFCGSCGWTYDQDPTTEYYIKKFPVTTPSGIQLQGIPSGKCASCHARGLDSDLAIQDDSSKMFTHTTVDKTDLDVATTFVLDDSGNTVMVDSGKTKFVLNKDTGKIDQVVILIEQTRPLTKSEKDEKLLAANKMVDLLDSPEKRA